MQKLTKVILISSTFLFVWWLIQVFAGWTDTLNKEFRNFSQSLQANTFNILSYQSIMYGPRYRQS